MREIITIAGIVKKLKITKIACASLYGIRANGIYKRKVLGGYASIVKRDGFVYGFLKFIKSCVEVQRTLKSGADVVIM